jgi:hypothetical protein
MPEIIGLGKQGIADQQNKKSQYGIFFQQPDGICDAGSFSKAINPS